MSKNSLIAQITELIHGEIGHSSAEAAEVAARNVHKLKNTTKAEVERVANICLVELLNTQK